MIDIQQQATLEIRYCELSSINGHAKARPYSNKSVLSFNSTSR